MQAARWMVGPIALGIGALAITIACGKNLPPEAEQDGGSGGGSEGGGADADDCRGVTISCADRCGTVEKCGIKVDCGGCAAPLTCSPDNTCECVSRTCDSLKASCGSFPDGCGRKNIACGSCATGSCQKNGTGAFVCDTAPCSKEPEAQTCANDACGTVINNCTQSIDCPCDKLCVSGASGPKCSCPSAPTAVEEWLLIDGVENPDTYHCYGNIAACDINGFSARGPHFRLHAQPFAGLVELYRCSFTDPKTNNTMLTTNPAVDCLGKVNQTKLGYCAQTSLCGSLPLNRFRRKLGPSVEDRMYTIGTNPPGTDYDPDPATNVVCYVWPP